jgi:hypothetical protein
MKTKVSTNFMTAIFKFCDKTVTRCLNAILGFIVLLTSVAWAGPSARYDQLRLGIEAAQACEKEIDDDLGPYEECVGHAANRLRNQARALLGLHFQAWLMADLAARQKSGRAGLVREHHHRELQRQLKATAYKLALLCEFKQLDCTDVRQRMAQRL